MFYVSRVSPLLFVFGIFNLFLSLVFKLLGTVGPTFFTVVVFGFIGSVLLGAMYQIIPNSQNRKLPAHRISYVVLCGHVLGIFLVYMGMYGYGSLALAVAYGVFLVHVLAVIKNWMPVTVKFLAMSALYLTTSAMLLAVHFNTGLVSLQLAVHTLTVGAMLNAIYGVELAWIPMLLMETINIKQANRLFYLKQVSTVVVLLSFYFMNYKALALASLLELGVAFFFGYMLYSLINRRRMPSPLPYVVRTFLFALVFLPIGILLALVSSAHPPALPKLYLIHIDFMVYGFAGFTIFGGIAHLLPRIVWNWVFAPRQSGNIPSIGELINEREFPFFLEKAFLMFMVFVSLDSLFEPLNRLSAFVYTLILLYFSKVTLFHLFKKLMEVKNGGDKASGGEVQRRST